MKVLLNAGLPVFVLFGKELSPFRGRHHSVESEKNDSKSNDLWRIAIVCETKYSTVNAGGCSHEGYRTRLVLGGD